MIRGVVRASFMLALIALIGCGDSGPKVVPVSGKVTLDGNPMSLGMVTFHPDESKGNNTVGTPTGMIQSDGTYKLNFNGKDGAPIGWYKVTVNSMGMPTNMGNMPAQDMSKMNQNTTKVNAKFQKPETGLSVEIVSSPAAGAYDLKVTK